MAGLSGKVPYEIVEFWSYTEQAAEIEPDTRILDEKLDELKWTICRIPLAFPTVGGSNLRLAHYHGDPEMVIRFMFDGSRVMLLGIERLYFDT